MNILLITARADHGGGPRSTLNLAREFSKRNHSIFVALPRDKPYFDVFRQTLGPSSLVEIPHRKISLSALYRVATFIRYHRIQLLHSNGKGAGAYAKLLSVLCGVPFVHTPRGISVFAYSRLKIWSYRSYENSFNRYCKTVVFVSESEKRWAEELGLWDKVPNLVIKNSISLARTQDNVRASTKRLLPFGEHHFVVATIARFDVAKNMGEAFQIAIACPDIKFLWIGDGPDREQLETKAFELGVKNIHFFGESADPISLLAFCDAYLSTSRWEGLPNALLEAGLMSLPCVVSKVIGNVDVILEGENGLLYGLGKIESAVRCLNRLKADLILCRRLGSKARKHIEDCFSDSYMFGQYDALYRRSIRAKDAG